MRAQIIKAFLPWLLFFAFANNTLLGLKAGVISGILILLIFNRGGLKKRFLLEWVTLTFFVLLLAAGAYFQHPFIIAHSLSLAYTLLGITCVFSLARRQPIAVSYARLDVSKSYWENPMFLHVNTWITLCWGFAFLMAAVSVAINEFSLINNPLWLLKIIPTICILSAAGFTILFPDIYKYYAARQNGVSALSDISDIQLIALNPHLTIGYRTLGEGPLIVCIEGYGMNMHHWPPDLLKTLARHYSVLIFDLPDLGYSRAQDLPFNTSSIADHLHQLLTQLKLKPLAVLGYSMGGFIAQTFALQYPDQLSALILINTCSSGSSGIPTPESIRQIMRGVTWKDKVFVELFFPDDAQLGLLEKTLDLSQSAALHGDMSPAVQKKEKQLCEIWYADESITPALAQTNIPALIITGLKDIIVSPDNSTFLKSQFPNSQLVTYDSAGHGVIYQYPLDVADKITEFLHGTVSSSTNNT